MGIYHSIISFSLSFIAISLLTLSQFCFKPSFGLVALTSINDLEWASDQRLAKNYIVYLQSACHLDFGFSYAPEIPVDYEFFQNFELPFPLDDHSGDNGGDDNYNSNMNRCIVLGLLQGPPSSMFC
jgi:ABC-type dipeptide/oligopeptide/nickel transport system permease component